MLKHIAYNLRLNVPKPAYVVLAAVLISILVGCSNEQQQSAPPPSVGVIEVKKHQVAGSAEYIGRSGAILSAEIKARIEGVILKRDFQEGQNVSKGDVLFEIEDSTYVAQAQQARASLKSSEAALSQAERDYQRGKELRPDGFISASDLDQLLSATIQARAKVEGDRAALETALINLKFTKIKAPFDGQISRANFTEGNLVNSSSGSLATLSQNDPIYVNFQISEKEYVAFAQSNVNDPNEYISLSLQLPDGSILKQPGFINYQDTKVNTTTGTVNIRAQFDNPDGIVLPGLYVTVRATTKDTRALPLIPQYAVQENQVGMFVLVVDEENQIGQRIVELGSREGPFFVVESGLEENEKIIVEGLQKVRVGAAVNPAIKQLNYETGALSEFSENATESSGAPEAQPEKTPGEVSES